jgi:hypothetical protein
MVPPLLELIFFLTTPFVKNQEQKAQKKFTSNVQEPCS